MVENKGNVSSETDSNKFTEYFQYKKEQIMVDTIESKKAKALWQTLRLYSALYDGFLLSILRDD